MAIITTIAMFSSISANNENIVITLDPQATISISLNQNSWQPDCAIGDGESTELDWATITNNGDITVDVTVNATNTTDWILGTSVGHNIFNLAYLEQTGSEQTYERVTSGGFFDIPVNYLTTTKWHGMTFKVGTAGDNATHYATKASIYLMYASGSAATLNLSIQEGTTGKGYTLAYGTVNAGTTSGDKQVTFDSPCILEAGQWYTLIAKTTTTSNTYAWKFYHENPYDGLNNQIQTTDSGGTWTTPISGAGNDGDFRFSITGFAILNVNIHTTPTSFISDFLPTVGSNTHNFGLKVEMPITSSTNVEQTTTIKFLATTK